MVLANVCQQFDTQKQEWNDASVFLALENGDPNDTKIFEGEQESNENQETVILESVLAINMPYGERFQGACIDSGAQLTIIELRKAEARCQDYGENFINN